MVFENCFVDISCGDQQMELYINVSVQLDTRGTRDIIHRNGHRNS